MNIKENCYKKLRRFLNWINPYPYAELQAFNTKIDKSIEDFRRQLDNEFPKKNTKKLRAKKHSLKPNHRRY